MSVKKASEANENIVAQLWFRYSPYWPLFALFFVLTIAGTWFYLLYKVPMYEATANILIKDEKKGLDDSKTIESLNMLNTKKIIENEIEVLHSRSIMYEVVKKLNLYAPVYEEGRFKPKSAYTSSPIKIQALNPELVVPSGKVYFSFDQEKGEVVVGSSRYPLNQFVSTPQGTLMFLRNEATSVPTGKLYYSLIDPRIVTKGLLGSLNVIPASKLSTVLNLKVTDELPRRAEDVLNELMAQYNKAALNDKNALAVNTLAFVEDRLADVAHDLDSIEHKVQLYKSNKGAIDISGQSQMYLQSVGQNDQKLGEVNMKMSVLSQVEQYVASKNSRGGIVPSTVGVNDPMLSQLLDKLYGLELEQERLKKTTGENNPIAVSITDQISKIKPSILENIESQRKSLSASQRNLATTSGQFTSMLYAIPKKERELVEISRDQNIKQNIYTFLLRTREEVALSSSSKVADSRIVDRAEASPVPVSPNKKLYYMIAAALAFALGFGFIGANEAFNGTILFRAEIESFTSAPIISEIAYEKLKTPIVIGNEGHRFMAEQFRRLRATVFHMGIKGKQNTVLLTSTISGEGKSFIAANLALALAVAGKKVALVEFDLSNPGLSDKLGQHNKLGVSEYLRGETEAENIIRRSEQSENLFFIGAGKLPRNPSELILSNRSAELIKYLKEIFDYVVVDSAPSGPSSDAYALSPLCDLTLYVIRHKYTPKILVKRMDENNKITNLKNIAIIFNGVSSRGFRKDTYGYGYGYGYAHNFYAAKDGKYMQGADLN